MMLALILALSLQAQNDSLRATLAKCATVHHVSHSRPVAQRRASRSGASGGTAVRLGGPAVSVAGRVHSPEKVAGTRGHAPTPESFSGASPPPSGFLSGEVNQSLRWRAASGEAEPRPGGAVVSGGNQYRPSPGFYRRHPGWSTLGAIGLGALVGTAICQTNHEHGVRVEWRTREVLTDPPPPVSPPDDDDHEGHHWGHHGCNR
jgi:hypothetical protein